MTLYTKICISLAGIAAGVVVMFAIDMVFNSGKFIAHSLHTRTPECSGACHGSTEQVSTSRPTSRMVLPNLQTADRSHATPPGPGGGILLGVHVEVKGRR